MSDATAAISAEIRAEPPVEAVPILSSRERRTRWLELALVLLVAFAVSILGSVNVLIAGKIPESRLQTSRWGYQLVQKVVCLLVLGYVLSRRRLRFRDLGLRWSWRDIGAGLLVTIASYISYCVGYTLVHAIHSSIYHSATPNPGAHQFFPHTSLAAVPFFLLNPFFEELIVRAYLMTEVQALTGSWTLAVALSVAIQFSYHLYYGWVGALGLSFQFLVFAIYYARTRRATPIIFAHGVFDLWGLVQLW
jgi:membrane protease YdiL (CAAX protease family)